MRTIKSVGPEFFVSFEIFVNSFSPPNMKHGKYAEVFRLSTTEGNCCKVGDRIVQIATVGGTEEIYGFELSSFFSHHVSYKFNFPQKDAWTKVDIELSLDAQSGKVVNILLKLNSNSYKILFSTTLQLKLTEPQNYQLQPTSPLLDLRMSNSGYPHQSHIV